MKNLDRAAELILRHTGCSPYAYRWVRHEIIGIMADEFCRGFLWGSGITGFAIVVGYAAIFFLRSSP